MAVRFLQYQGTADAALLGDNDPAAEVVDGWEQDSVSRRAAASRWKRPEAFDFGDLGTVLPAGYSGELLEWTPIAPENAHKPKRPRREYIAFVEHAPLELVAFVEIEHIAVIEVEVVSTTKATNRWSR